MKDKIALLLILLYCLAGTTGSVLFRQGGVYENYYWLFFVLGNTFGWISTWILMLIYARFKSANIANMLCVASSSVIGQLVMWLLFRSPFNWQMLTGFIIMTIGIIIGAGASEPAEQKTEEVTK